MTVPQTLALVGGQVDYLKSEGWTVEVVSSNGPELERFGQDHDVDVHIVDMPRRITPLADWRALHCLTKLLRRLRPSVVHAHTPKGGLLGTLAARRASVPAIVYQMRGLLLPTATGVRRHLLKAAERTSCSRADWVLCQGPSLRRAALAEGLCKSDRSSVLFHGGNGIDTGLWDPDTVLEAGCSVRGRHGICEGDLVMGFVGRLVRDKGVVELASAWQVLREKHQKLHWLVVGLDEERDGLPSEVLASLSEDPRVHRVGLTDAMRDHYAAMDLLVLPSYREGLPNAPLEAAAMRLPVVLSDAMGCVDAMVPGVTGLQTPVGAVQPLIDAVDTYANSPALRREHGAAGRLWVAEAFEPRRIWQAQQELYVDLLEKAA